MFRDEANYISRCAEFKKLGWPEDKFKTIYDHPVIADAHGNGFFNTSVYEEFRRGARKQQLMESIIALVRCSRYSEEWHAALTKMLDDIYKDHVKLIKRRRITQIRRTAQKYEI